MDERPTFLSLFAGIGGIDLGLERAGWRCAGQVEIDPFCQRVLAKHWPDVARWADIRELDPADLPAVDLVAGGFPCQPTSLAGRRRAQADERWLWPEFARVLRHLRPRLVLLENPPGLLSAGFGDVLGDLAALGYDAEWDCISAADVGAPHQRDRIFVVAYPDGCGWRPGPGIFDGMGPPRCGSGVAYAERDRLEGVQPARSATGAAIGGGSLADTAEPRPPQRDGGAGRRPGASRRMEPAGLRGTPRELATSDQWTSEPDVGRVAHGVPARVDRLRGLGNAVVPQVAEVIGAQLLAVLTFGGRMNDTGPWHDLVAAARVAAVGWDDVRANGLNKDSIERVLSAVQRLQGALISIPSEFEEKNERERLTVDDGLPYGTRITGRTRIVLTTPWKDTS